MSEELLSLVSDERSLKIFAALWRNPKSAGQISNEKNIPTAGCYRQLRKLEKKGMIRREGKGTVGNGKSSILYQSNVRKIDICYEKFKIYLTITLRNTSINEEILL